MLHLNTEVSRDNKTKKAVKKKTMGILVTVVLLGIVLIGYFLLYQKPVLNPSPIFAIKGKLEADSLSDLPFDKKYIRRIITDNAKERIFPAKQSIELNCFSTTVYVTLFYNAEDALAKYSRFRKEGQMMPVNDHGDGYNRYFVTSLQRDFADQFGLFQPMDHYYGNAGFIKQTVVIHFSSILSGKKDTSLNDAVEYVGSVLKTKFR